MVPVLRFVSRPRVIGYRWSLQRVRVADSCFCRSGGSRKPGGFRTLKPEIEPRCRGSLSWALTKGRAWRAFASP